MNNNKKDKPSIFSTVSEYTGSDEVFYKSYYELEGCYFPDLFRDPAKDDVDSLLQNVASTRASRLYADLLFAKIHQDSTSKHNKDKQGKLASYMIDLLLKTMGDPKQPVSGSY